MCTIGYVKTDKGFILFKNRDKLKENIRKNYVNVDENLISFEDENIDGCWMGFNKHGVGFSYAIGPKKLVKGFPYIFKMNKYILENSKNTDEAISKFIESYKKYNFKGSFNIIFCDKNKAKVLEIVGDKFCVEDINGSCFRTNRFELMKEFNNDSLKVERAKKRLKRFLGLFDKKNILQVLKHHSEDNESCICKHKGSITTGSVVFEMIDNKLIVNSLLNGFPCENEYNKEVFSLEQGKIYKVGN